MRSIPMSASIARRSSGEFGMYLIRDLLRRFFLDVVVVLDGSQKSVYLRGVVYCNSDHPAFAVGVFVDLLRGIVEAFVPFGNRAAHRHINFADCFYAFNRTEWLRSLELVADFWKLNVDDVTKLFLRVVGDSHRGLVSFHPEPFVVFRITKVFWCLCHLL